MKILVDADACPVKEIIVRQAKKRRIPVVMLLDTSHILNDGYSKVITVDKGRDSVDIRLANLLEAGDIVVTQDFGVAALALGSAQKRSTKMGWSMTTTIWINCCLNAILDRRSGGLVEGPLGRKSVRAQMMNPLKELL